MLGTSDLPSEALEIENFSKKLKRVSDSTESISDAKTALQDIQISNIS